MVDPSEPDSVHAASDRPSDGGFLGSPPAEFSSSAAGETAYQPAVARVLPGDHPLTPTSDVVEEDVTAEHLEPAPTQRQPKKKAKKSKLSEPALWVIEIAAWIVGALVISTLLRVFVVQMFVVPSVSMDSTLKVNDRIAALKLAHYQRGDIVVFADPGDWLTTKAEPVGRIRHFFELIGVLASTDQQYLVKRIIGMPGDRVQCCTAGGHLWVNGQEIDESQYLNKQPGETDPLASTMTFDVTVPAGRVFVMGDNRGDSADSRFHLCQMTDDGLGMDAFVPETNIVGPVRAVVLPFQRMGHRATPVSVFANVPAPSGDPPAKPLVSVTGGWTQTCQS